METIYTHGVALTSSYRLHILTPTGVLKHILAANPSNNDPTKGGFLELAYTNYVNAPGDLAFLLDGEHVCLPDLVDRAQVEIWRSDPDNSIDWYRDWSGLFLDEDRWMEDGLSLYKGYCAGDQIWLGDRIVAYDADTADRSAFVGQYTETIMKTLATYNCTASASVVNGRDTEGAITGFTVETDSGVGGNIQDWKCARDNLLTTLQKLADVAGGDFDVIKTGAATWQFRWYAGQRGTDRTADVIFSLDHGNMGDPHYSLKRSSRVTSVIVGGQGVASARIIRKRTGNGYSASNNIEAFYNGSSQNPTAAGLDALGDQYLYKMRDQEEFSFNVLQTPACLYGKHYFLGDIVTAKYLTTVTTPKIVSTGVSVESGDKDNIDIGLSYVG